MAAALPLFVCTLIVGAIVRFALFAIFQANPTLYLFVSNRVEISTPISSWKSFIEGLYLSKHGLSPYASDVFHSSPILLKIFEHVHDLQLFETQAVDLLFIASDMITAICVYYIAYSSQTYFLSKHNIHNESNQVCKLKRTLLASPYFSVCVALFYYFNPFVILPTCCKSVSNLMHCLICVSISLSIHGSVTLSSMVLAMATIIDVYPFLLLPVNIAMLLRSKQYKSRALLIALSIFAFVISLAYLFALNFKFNDLSWNFIDKYYLFIFDGRDITPNVGGWWYFKQSLFNRFQSFFTIIFNLQPLVFVFPFLWRFGSYPYFCYYLTIYLFQIFRVYPCISDTILGITFLWISSFIQYNHYRHTLGLIIVYFIGIQLMFFMWYMWIVGGTGNANFYYAGNLLFCACNLYTLCISIASARRHLNAEQGK